LYVYLDDVIIFERTFKEMLVNLRVVFLLLRERESSQQKQRLNQDRAF